MTAPDPSLDPRAALRRKRIALTVVGAVAVAFIGASVLQIIPAVFGMGVVPVPSGASGSAENACATGIQRLAKALDRAQAAAGGPGFEQALSPEWQDAPQVQASCARSSSGLDAWAALLRLRTAEQQLAGRPGDPLDPLRAQLASHLPADLR